MEIKNDAVVFYKSDENTQWRWRRTAENGQIIGASTESFHNFKDCHRNFTMNLCSNYEIDIEEK